MPRLPPPFDPDATELALGELGAEARELRRVIDDATATPIYIDYRHAPEWFEGLAAAIDAVEDHLRADPTAVLLLSEHALLRLESAGLDDSDGWLTQAVPRLGRLHAQACERLAIPPVELAARLSAFAAASELETFYEAAETHAGALGADGIRALRNR